MLCEGWGGCPVAQILPDLYLEFPSPFSNWPIWWAYSDEEKVIDASMFPTQSFFLPRGVLCREVVFISETRLLYLVLT